MKRSPPPGTPRGSFRWPPSPRTASVIRKFLTSVVELWLSISSWNLVSLAALFEMKIYPVWKAYPEMPLLHGNCMNFLWCTFFSLSIST
jgi:hypothetical protein